jgi:protein transport protein SEC61 subunit gamma-like protein
MEETNTQPQQAPQEVQKKEEQKPKEQKVDRGPNIFGRIKNKLLNYKRVIDVSKKPTREEFVSTSKITASGIVLIGMIGFVIFLIYFLATL